MRGPLPSWSLSSQPPLLPLLPCPPPSSTGTFLSPRTLSLRALPLCLSWDKPRLSVHLLATSLFIFLGLFSRNSSGLSKLLEPADSSYSRGAWTLTTDSAKLL